MKNQSLIRLTLLILLLTGVSSLYGEPPGKADFGELKWQKLTQLPSEKGMPNIGLAGAFSGISNNCLIIAGGANFPGKSPLEGGIKRWWRDIYVYDFSKNSWHIFKNALPEELAYGVSVTLPDGVLCIGGSNKDKISGKVFLIKYKSGGIEFETWPSLPFPLSNMSGILTDNKIFIAGGQKEINGGATNTFIVYDLINKSGKWISPGAWNGRERILPVMVSQKNGMGNCIYLFSGRDVGPDRPLRVLDDGYEYNIKSNSWKRLDNKEVRFPVMAGLGFSSGANHIYLLGGANNRQIEIEDSLKKCLVHYTENNNENLSADSVKFYQDKIIDIGKKIPEFSRQVLVFHTITGTLVEKEASPFNIPVTTNLVYNDGDYLICSGEIKPGVRTPDIIKVEPVPYNKGLGRINIVVIILYFIVLLWIGIYFSKRQRSSKDYFKGGERVPWWAVGLSIFGTALSAITFMALPAKAYATDWSYMLMNAGIILVAPIVIYLFIPFYRRLDVSTAYEYLEKRFNLSTRLISSISFILFQIGRMGIVLLLPSIALNVVTGIDIFLCVLLMGVLSLIYTMMGGIEAVIWTDALQVVVLMGGAIFAVVYIAGDIDGGLSSIISQGIADGKFSLGDTGFNLNDPTVWTILIASFFTNVTTYGTDQTMVQRYLTTKDSKTANKSVWVNALMTIPATILFFVIGTCLFVFYKQNPDLLSTTINDGDAVFPWFINTQLPDGISGLLISGIFAAAMSTLSSSMNSAATAYAVDIHFRFGWTKNVDQLKLARLSTLFIGTVGILFALMMATWNTQSLWDEFQRILGLILGSLGGLFLLGLLTRKANGKGAVTGLVGSIIVQIIISYNQSVHLLLFATTGFISCFVIGYLSSFLFKDNKNIESLTIYKKV